MTLIEKTKQNTDVRRKRPCPCMFLKAGFMCPWKSLPELLQLQVHSEWLRNETQTIWKTSTCIIIYGAQEPVPPQEAPLPIKKWREMGGGARSWREKCLWKKIFLNVLFSGSCLAWCCMCFQSGMSLWAPSAERGHQALGLSSAAPHPLPACLAADGSSGTVGLENIPQLAWAVSVWHPSQKHRRVSVSTCALIVWGFILVKPSHWDIWIAEVSGGLWMRVRAFFVPRGRLQCFSSPPTSLLFECIVMGLIALAPTLRTGSRALCTGSSWWFLGRLGGRFAELGRERQRKCRKHVWATPALISSLLWLGPSLSQASTLVPIQFIHHAVAEATFLNHKHAILWLRDSQRLPEILL